MNPSSQPPVPRELEQRVHQNISQDLAWLPYRSALKVGLAHLTASLLTLSVCPQFDFRIAGTGMGLMHYFMELGEVGCAVACGGFFMMSSAAMIFGVLNPNERNFIFANTLATTAVLLLISLGGFWMMNPQAVVQTGLAWIVGAVSGYLLVKSGFRWGMRLAYR